MSWGVSCCSCSLGTGFTGTYEEVAAHEQRVLAQRRQEELFHTANLQATPYAPFPPLPGWASLPGSVQYPNTPGSTIQVLNSAAGFPPTTPVFAGPTAPVWGY